MTFIPVPGRDSEEAILIYPAENHKKDPFFAGKSRKRRIFAGKQVIYGNSKAYLSTGLEKQLSL
jgi:hypothetical protein